MILVEQVDSVAVLKFNKGATNPMDLKFVDELAEVLQRLKTDNKVRGLVLCSSNDKFFSIGWDIPQLFDLSRLDFEHFFYSFNRACMELYTLPKPTIAAITGHAIAGGCILALCCDYRIIAQGRKLMGLNEIKLGVPVPYLADCVLRQLVGVRYAREIMDIGEFYSPQESQALGLVDQVYPLEQVLEKTIEKAELLGSQPGLAFATIKRNRLEEIEIQVEKYAEEKTRLFLECWFSDETRERLQKAMEKF